MLFIVGSFISNSTFAVTSHCEIKIVSYSFWPLFPMPIKELLHWGQVDIFFILGS